MSSRSNRPAVTRAQYLIDLVAASGFSETKAETELERVRIPPSVLENPDALVSVSRVFDFIESKRQEASPVELGLRVREFSRFENTDPKFQSAVTSAVTGLDVLKAVLRYCQVEDSTLDASIRAEGDFSVISLSYASLSDRPAHIIAEMQNIAVLTDIGKVLGGADWTPPRVRLVHGAAVVHRMRQDLHATRIETGGHSTCFYVPRELVGLPWPDQFRPGDGSIELTTTQMLRELIRPYLAEGPVTLQDASELSGLSPRTLQRRLAAEERVYKDVVEEARYQIACALLADPAARIIDVAFAAGYSHQGHFTRAFRRRTGLTPTAYRSALSRR